jgi:hypothetical protein
MSSLPSSLALSLSHLLHKRTRCPGYGRPQTREASSPPLPLFPGFKRPVPILPELLGLPTSWISQVQLVMSIKPDMHLGRWSAQVEPIERNGGIVPVLVDEAGLLISGEAIRSALSPFSLMFGQITRHIP